MEDINETIIKLISISRSSIMNENIIAVYQYIIFSFNS